MSNYLLYTQLAFSLYCVYRVIKEAKSYRNSWSISWFTAFRFHVEWLQQTVFVISGHLVILAVFGVCWLVANYGCMLLKGVQC